MNQLELETFWILTMHRTKCAWAAGMLCGVFALHSNMVHRDKNKDGLAQLVFLTREPMVLGWQPELMFLTIQSKVAEVTGCPTLYEEECVRREAGDDHLKCKVVDPWEGWQRGTGNSASTEFLPVPTCKGSNPH